MFGEVCQATEIRLYRNSIRWPHPRTDTDAHRICFYPPTSARRILSLIVMELDGRTRIMPSVFATCGSCSAPSTRVLEPLRLPLSALSTPSIVACLCSHRVLHQTPSVSSHSTQPFSHSALQLCRPGFDSSELDKRACILLPSARICRSPLTACCITNHSTRDDATCEGRWGLVILCIPGYWLFLLG